MTVEQAKEAGYLSPRILLSGECAGLYPMTFTWGLFVGLTMFYRTRFCYPIKQAAEKALAEWDGFGDPPGPWIKEFGAVQRVNPNYKPGPGLL